MIRGQVNARRDDGTAAATDVQASVEIRFRIDRR